MENGFWRFARQLRRKTKGVKKASNSFLRLVTRRVTKSNKPCYNE